MAKPDRTINKRHRVEYGRAKGWVARRFHRMVRRAAKADAVKAAEEMDVLNIADIVLTAEDYKKYPYHTGESILGRKFIASFSDEELQRMLKDEDFNESIRVQVGPKTNPNWINSEILDAMYERDLIDEDEYATLLHEHC